MSPGNGTETWEEGTLSPPPAFTLCRARWAAGSVLLRTGGDWVVGKRGLYGFAWLPVSWPALEHICLTSAGAVSISGQRPRVSNGFPRGKEEQQRVVVTCAYFKKLSWRSATLMIP